MGFRPGNLLFFQPVLLQARQWRESRVCRMSLAAALFVVQICAAIGAKSAAIAAANYLHRQSQQNLFTKYIRQEQPFPLKKSNLCVVVLQLCLFRTLSVR